MTEQEVASYKEQMFGHSSTQSPTPDVVPPADTPPVDNTPTDLPPADTPPSSHTPADIPPVDYNAYIKENFGFDDVEQAKSQIAELKALKENTPAPISFANEESEKVFNLLKEGKVKEVKAIYDLQDKLEGVDTLTPTEAIKLHIEQTNKHYKKADVEDVFEEKYTFPEKPIQGTDELDEDFEAREERYKSSVEKINRRIERDAVTAKDELSKLKQEIKLPEIPSVPNPELEEFNAHKEGLVKADENHKLLVDSVSKLTEKDVSLQLSFNDEAKKVKFDISYQGDKDGVEKAKASASNYLDFLSQTYYKEDGSPLADKLTSDIYFLQNRDKIITEAVNQAVNETMLQMARNQKNIGDGIHRNFNIVQPSELEKLKEQVFAKTG